MLPNVLGGPELGRWHLADGGVGLDVKHQRFTTAVTSDGMSPGARGGPDPQPIAWDLRESRRDGLSARDFDEEVVNAIVKLQLLKSSSVALEHSFGRHPVAASEMSLGE